MRNYLVFSAALALITSTAQASLDESFFDLGKPSKIRKAALDEPLFDLGDASQTEGKTLDEFDFTDLGMSLAVPRQKSRSNNDISQSDSDEDDDFTMIDDSLKGDDSLATSINVRGLKNLTQEAYGDQMTPGRLYVEMGKVLKFSDEKEWMPSKARYDSGAAFPQPIYHARQEQDGSRFIVTSPTHDLGNDADDTNKQLSGNLSVRQALEAVIRENPRGKLTVTVPLAQANFYMLGMVKRGHWTNATFVIENGKIIKSKLYDSKGWLSALYGGGSHVQQQVASLQADQKVVEVNYLGHQGVRNNKDCGRFAVRYIDVQNNAVKPETLSTPQATSFFSKLWKTRG